MNVFQVWRNDKMNKCRTVAIKLHLMQARDAVYVCLFVSLFLGCIIVVKCPRADFEVEECT
jgi:hypothetical protein